jgi:protein involved in polysaccharide export with SLBB domain
MRVTMSPPIERRLSPASAVLGAFLSLALLTGCAGTSGPAPEAPAPAKADIDGYRLGAGDQIRLVVYDEPNLTGEHRVDGTGSIGVPLIGQVKAGGLTVSEIEKEIASRLSPDFVKDPSINIEVIGYRPFYIVGEVKAPGSYPYVNGMTVINAVALAGGYTYRARERNFRIERAGKEGVRVLEGQGTTEVLPGDVITVHERYF